MRVHVVVLLALLCEGCLVSIATAQAISKDDDVYTKTDYDRTRILTSPTVHMISICNRHSGYLDCTGQSNIEILRATLTTSLQVENACVVHGLSSPPTTCQVAMTEQVSLLCSGKRRCEVPVSNEMFGTVDCGTMPMHLEIEATCSWNDDIIIGPHAVVRPSDTLWAWGDPVDLTMECTLPLALTNIISWITFAGFISTWTDHVGSGLAGVELAPKKVTISGVLAISSALLYAIAGTICVVRRGFDLNTMTTTSRRGFIRMAFLWLYVMITVFLFGIAQRPVDSTGPLGYVSIERHEVSLDDAMSRVLDAGSSAERQTDVKKLWIQLSPQFMHHSYNISNTTVERFPSPERGTEPGQYLDRGDYARARAAVVWARKYAGLWEDGSRFPTPSIGDDFVNDDAVTDAQLDILKSWLRGRVHLSKQNVADDVDASKPRGKLELLALMVEQFNPKTYGKMAKFGFGLVTLTLAFLLAMWLV